MNSDTKFAAFYVTFIAVAVVGSLYAGRLNPSWNRKVFTFPPETQKVVENGTATMEVKWRWLSDTLEMIVKVNDDDFNETRVRFNHSDWIGLLFDSDNNGNLTVGSGNADEQNDHGVFITGSNISYIYKHCHIIPEESHMYYGWGAVMWRQFWCENLIDIIVEPLNSSYCIYREGEGYTFKLSIPRELINVEPPTPIHVSFFDDDVVMKEAYSHNKTYQATIAADFTG